VTNEVRVEIDSDADTVIARQQGRVVALRIGLSRTDATFVATAISEIARNIITHAGRGEIVIGEVREKGRAGMRVVARDAGPGISDVEAVLRHDYASEAGLGIGLWGAQRLMDEVTVTSEPGKGTTVTMIKWCGSDEVGVLLKET
jgi:anti-sigma regulatory factor (Ser/Thr protein kinase)